MTETQTTLLSDAVKAEIDVWLAKYPADRRRSAVIPALHVVQEAHGWLDTPMMDAVAAYIGMAPTEVYEVATFYSMYDLEPVGKHKINVCGSISCKLRGCGKTMDYLSQKLGVKVGETTSDGRFTLREVECLGACVGAPMMLVDKTYHEHLTPEKIDKILEELD